jgi:hypothetical protein
LTIASLTAVFGVVASVAGVRTAIAVAGILMLATPLLLPAMSVFAGPEQELGRNSIRPRLTLSAR